MLDPMYISTDLCKQYASSKLNGSLKIKES
jgi:hypothetical protein